MFFYDEDDDEPINPLLDDEDEDEEDGEDGGEDEDEGEGPEQDGDSQSRDRKDNRKKDKDKEDGSKDEKSSEQQDGKKPDGQGQDGKQGDGQNLDPDNVRNDMQNASDNLDAKNGKGQGQGGSQQGSSANANANASTGSTPSGSPTGGTTPPGGATPTPTPAAGAGATGGGAGASAGGTAAAGGAGGAATAGSTAAAGSGAAAGGTAAGASATAASSAAASGSAAAAGGGAAAALAPVIAVIAIVILIIIVVVGLVFFLIAMPGQVVGKLKKLGLDFLDKFQALVEGKENVIHTEDLADVANYLEKMGYDLKGEGFISGKSDSEKPIDSNPDSPNYQSELQNVDYDAEQDVWRDESGKVVKLNSDPIMTYIVSDNLCYIIKNFNQNLETATGGNADTALSIGGWILGLVGLVVGIIFSPIAAIVAVVAVAAGSMLAFATASNPNWGTGLISIWHEGSDIGIRGKAYDAKETGSISLDPASKKLSVKRGWRNNSYTFDVDGWSGRYGMPLEFLLSVHIATQMPDLAIEMATTFDTDVEVLLRSVDDGSVVAGVLKSWAPENSSSDSDYLTYEQLKDIQSKYGNFWTNVWNGIKEAIDWLAFWKKPSASVTLNDGACYVLFANGLPHSKDCTCCKHIVYHKSVEATDSDGASANACADCGKDDGITLPTDPSDMEDFGKSDLDGHIVCEACKDRLTAIAAAMSVVDDNNWESYTPYISKVTNHWFRDVYFVINEGEEDPVDAVDVDDLYFYETGERWTIYETYEASDTIPEGFEVGDYKLYEYDPSKSGDGWNNGYKLFTGSAEEVEARKEKITQGDTSVSRLIKKPVTERYTSFNAYDTNAGEETLPWEKLSVTESAKGELQADAVYQDEDASTPDDMIIYYKETRPGDVKQVEDGIRAETNPTIKNMFVNNVYYKYDGSVEKAKKIMEDRKKYDEGDYEKFNTDNDPRMNDEETINLISKVNISKDSLGAFSMLENTHTLDADYVYRDFKELIVELDYFDKEELSDKIQDVMQWLIPDAGSGGWPLRKYEKGETFYGTLINSKEDIKIMEDAAIDQAEDELDKLEDEVEPPKEETPTSPNPSNVVGSITSFVDKGYEIHKTMEDGGGWDYCVLRPEDCTHKYGHGCGLNQSIQEAVDQHHNTCCATYVSWVLAEVGYGFQSHGAKDTYDKVKELGFMPITDYNSLEPGDLLFNKHDYDGTDVANIGHVQILGNNGEWLNAGSVDAINNPPKSYTANFIIGMRPTLNGAAKQFEGYEPDQDVVSPVTGKIIEHGTVMRDNIETGEKEEVEFIKIQAIDHCVYDTDGSPIEQGKGYKAAVDPSINNEEYGDGGRYKEYDPEVQNDLEGYDYFYEEYKGVMDGFVIYIEGFDLTLYDADGAINLMNGTEEDKAKASRYEPNPVYNMLDNDEEAYSLWKEDAKTGARPYAIINGEEYIKEGTVIGKTCEDPEKAPEATPPAPAVEGEEQTPAKVQGNGNYIRVIFRDLEDSVVEDVENYMKIDDGEFVSSSQPYQAQEGDLQLLANLLHHEGCGAYFSNCVFDGDTKLGDDASRVTGYVLINRALNNYGNHGTTIREQILAPGQYSTAYDVTEGEAVFCERCLANAEWCLKYDCSSVISPSNNTPMPRTVMGQSGWCQCHSGKFNCWWWIDTNKDGQHTEYTGEGKPFDTFYCE